MRSTDISYSFCVHRVVLVTRNITTGYNIGERSLVPNGANVFIDISVDRIDPFGER